MTDRQTSVEIISDWLDFKIHLFRLNKTVLCAIHDGHVKKYYSDTSNCNQFVVKDDLRWGS